jgi:pycsar effector protein
MPVPTTDSAGVDRLADAWRILGITNDWIKHVETKAGLTMAACAGLLSLLAGSVLTASKLPSFVTPVGLCAGVFLVAGLLSGIVALWPRRVGARPSLLFFGYVSERYAGSGSAYGAALVAQTPDELFGQVAGQIAANAEVAHRKYLWTGRALVCVAAGLAFVAVLVGVALVTRHG